MSEYVLRVENLTKIFKLYNKPTDRLKESLSLTKKIYHKKFYALNNISFNIKKGESLAIVGTNGSGKSTLLKIITGILNPTEGKVITNGKIAALLELGAGFNPEYTGIENIYLSGTLMGYSKAEMDQKLDRIIQFADIGDFVNQPVKSYSSGMFVRLAFATQIFSEPDILIVDEALSVGDLRFQQKCYRAMEELMKNKTVIIVTHDPSAVLRFCKRAIWIEKGNLMYDDNANTVLKKYQTFLLNSMEKGGANSTTMSEMPASNKNLELVDIDKNVEKAGTGEVEIIKCGFFDPTGHLCSTAEPGEKYTFAIKVKKNKPVNDLIIGLTVKNRLGSEVFALNSYMAGVSADSIKDECEYRMIFVMPKLNAGQYTISPAVAKGTYTDHIQLCWVHDAWIFDIPKRDFQIPGTIYLGKDFSFEIFNE